jgi:GDP-L-fucose synthase
MDKNSLIYVAWHHDIIGASIVSALRDDGYVNLILKGENELDLCDHDAVKRFFAEYRPEYVFLFAGPHGGINKNQKFPADLIYANLRIQCNVIHSAYEFGVKKLLFMSGGCVYPKDCPQPITEEYFMAGKQEPTSAAYSTARSAGIEMCNAYNNQYRTNFIPVVLTNYFGLDDDFSDEGHVLANVLRKIHQAKLSGERELTLWGTGAPQRQFMFSGDIADAAVLIMNEYDEKELINIAGGREFTISELAEEMKRLIGYTGNILFDISNPDGAKRKLLDNKKLLELGFVEHTGFEEGLRLLYSDYIKRLG